MTPELEKALKRYDVSCEELLEAQGAFLAALQAFLAAQRQDLLTSAGGTVSERCERGRIVRAYEDAIEDWRIAHERHRVAHQTVYDLSIGYQRAPRL